MEADQAYTETHHAHGTVEGQNPSDPSSWSAIDATVNRQDSSVAHTNHFPQMNKLEQAMH